jgi:hypothetical protein
MLTEVVLLPAGSVELATISVLKVGSYHNRKNSG